MTEGTNNDKKIIVSKESVQELNNYLDKRRDEFIELANGLHNFYFIIEKNEESKDMSEIAAYLGYIFTKHKTIISGMQRKTKYEVK